MNGRIKLGLMGAGKVAGYGHIPAIQTVKGLELWAIYDPSETRVREMQEQFGIAQGFTDEEAFFRSGIEAVTITSPAPVHAENVIACAAHKLAVLCEKPLCANASEGRRMLRAMSKAGVPLYAAFCYRFSPVALKIRELVRQNAIGRVRSLRLIYNWDLHGKYAAGPNGGRRLQKRREERMLEGGPMVDCGTHQIDLARFWLDSRVIRYRGHGAWVDDHEAPDHLWLHLDFSNGAHAMVEISYSYHHTAKNSRSEFVYELIGSEGVIRYDREMHTFTLENGAGRQDLPFAAEKDFVGLYQEFAKALRTGKSDLLTTGDDGLEVAEIARNATDAVIESRAFVTAYTAGTL